MKTILAPLLLSLAFAAVAADDEPPGDAARRAQLREERQAIQKDYARRQAECRDKFAVTACLARARGDMQAATKRIDEQELELNDAARERRTAKTTERLNAKAAAARAKQEAAASAPDRAEAPASGASRAAPKRSIDTDKLGKPTAPHSAEEEARSRERFDERQREIRAHREEVEKRNAERAKKSPAAQPLPVPPGVASAASR